MNSKKSNHQPVTDSSAVAEGVLAKADPYIAALQETHVSISRGLAEELRLCSALGAAEIAGDNADSLRNQLSAATTAKEASVRRRQAAAEGLLELEPELGRARAAADQQRAQLAVSVASEFSSRWNQCCRQLALLYAEAAQLSSALHAQVATPSPYTVALNAVTGRPELRLSLPLDPPPVASLPRELAAVTTTIDKLDAVRVVIGGIKQSREFDQRHFQLAILRHTPTEMRGSFVVLQPFTSQIDGLEFQPGALIDSSLCGPGTLHRLLQSHRFLRPASLENVAA